MMRPVPQRAVGLLLVLLLSSAVFLLPSSSFGQTAPGGFAQPDSGLGTVSCQPEQVRFHQVVQGQNSSLLVTMTNTGLSAVTISKITQSVPEFKLQNVKTPFTLKVGKSIQFAVVFSPDQTGHMDDQIGFINDGSNSPYYLYVHGMGVPVGALTANPPVVRFGNVQVGNNQSEYITLTNTGKQTITIKKAPVEGGGFSISGLDLPSTLGAGKSLTFAAIFTPQSEGDSYGHISIGSDAPNPSLRVGLAGTGTQAGQLSVSPPKINFGNVSVGSNKTLTGTLSATGADVVVSTAILNSAEFSLQGVTLPVTIPAGKKLDFQVVFQPMDRGQVSAKLAFISNASNSPSSEILVGNGVGAPDHSVTLTWKPSKSPDVVGYNVYRREQDQGSFTKLNNSLDLTEEYTDMNVQGGVTYVYVSTAVNSSGSESRHSKPVKAKIPYP